MRAPAALLAALLVGCADEEQLRLEIDEASCAWQAECNVHIEEAECLQAAAEAWEPAPEECRFRRKRARQCIDGLYDLPCPGEGTVSMPGACDRVWDCD